MDAPELAHFGNKAQPHGKESLEWLTNTLQGKRIKCQLLRKDQYGRIVSNLTCGCNVPECALTRQVGIPYLRRFILSDKPLPLMMLREGQAVVYTQGGSEYGPWGLDKMCEVENEAK